jgi:hypothetical protein
VNKESELFYLERFKENLPSFPQGIISPDERPDFLVKTSNGIVGIEITHFFRETKQGTQPLLQQREDLWRKIIQSAKSLYDKNGFPPAWIKIYFPPNFYCEKAKLQLVAEKIVRLVELHLSEPTNNPDEIWSADDIRQTGIRLIFCHKMKKLADSNWSTSPIGFVPQMIPSQIQEILDGKNVLCGEYLKKCDKIWLAIIVNRFAHSMFSLIPETILEHSYAHRFDSAFLFLYDYVDSQKPPFLLQKA